MKMIDLHCDTVLRLMEGGEIVSLRQNELSVDIQKLRKGGVVGQFFALFVDMAEHNDPFQYCHMMLDRFYREIEENGNDVALALDYNDFCANLDAGKVSAFLTIEEGGVLKGRLENLRNFYRLGVRLVTLTWNYPNEIGFPNAVETCRDKGLTPFGTEVVREMNRLGMIIDVSHLSDGGFYDVASVSNKPFVASHSNARRITGHARNLSDDMIKTLADKGGIMGINFARDFLGSSDISRIEDMVRHIHHIYNVGGIDVLAIGSDFDGIDPGLEIENSGEFDKLVTALAGHGFSEFQIEKICYKNALRVIKECLY